MKSKTLFLFCCTGIVFFICLWVCTTVMVAKALPAKHFKDIIIANSNDMKYISFMFPEINLTTLITAGFVNSMRHIKYGN